jgi:hypothetical protein
MGLKQILLTVLFGVHWIAFAVLFMRTRRWSLLLPLSVFTLLILTQYLWTSEAMVGLGPLGSHPLPTTLRASAIILAVPSIALMARRIVAKRRSRQELSTETASD